MPLSLDQYRAVRHAAGVMDRSQRGRLALRGPDRLTFLHALLTNDIAALRAGAGCYAAFLSPQGRMVADLRVFELGDTVLLDVHPSTTDALLQKFDQLHFSEDVEIADVTTVFGCISVQGPESPRILAAVTGWPVEALASWPPYRNARAPWRDETVIVARVDEFGVPGYFLFVSMTAVGSLAAATGALGAELVDADTADVLRVEAGYPEFTVDMNGETIPLEAGLEHSAISYTKGCFPGQEVLVRVRDRGHGRVARRLVGLVLDGNAVPDRGAAVRATGSVAGSVTSAVFSPALGRAIALAYVQRDHTEPGTPLEVDVAGTPVAAAVAALPFVGA